MRILCIGFWKSESIAICILYITGLYQASGSADFLMAYVILCVRFKDIVR